MKKLLDYLKQRFVPVKNWPTKLAFWVAGAVLFGAAFYQETLARFWLTERESSGISWPLAAIGFFLCTGGALYNKIAEALGAAISAIISILPSRFGSKNKEK